MNGKFIISLDFELHWGIFDHTKVVDYEENLKNTRAAIFRMLDLCEKYNVKLTFSTVGFLFAKDKKGLKKFIPQLKPTYDNKLLSPYRLIETEIGENEDDSPYHYANSIITLLKDTQHEIGTHTFSHYYCCEKGQTKEQFNEDIKSAVRIGKSLGIKVESIVFPRNQVNTEYLNICSNNRLLTYRGTENFWIYKPKRYYLLARALRLFDSYINISGYNTYNKEYAINSHSSCINLPSSRLFRAYNKNLKFLEPLKMNRIKKAMTYAAKNEEIFHLWWHPHNFGANLDKNISNLEEVFKHYNKLNRDHQFESETMSSLAKKIMENK